MEKFEERLCITPENNGQKIFGVLHLPIKAEKCPLVMVCHGLAGNKTGKYRVYVELACMLAKKGIATFRFDYRGCGDSEAEFREITPSKHCSDAILCLNLLKKHPSIDPDRIGIFGRSFGGPIALKTAASEGDIRSIVLWCPMFNGDQWRDQWNLLHTQEVNEEAKHKMMEIEGQEAGYEFFKEFFTINVSEDLQALKKVPFLHIHGDKDTRISPDQADLYRNIREKAEANSEFIRLPETDHDFSDNTERSIALKETVNRFINTL